MIKALWNANKFYTTNYPIVGPKSSGTAPVVVDLVKQGLKDSIDTLSIRIVGNIVIAGATGGAATGAENPQGLFSLVTLTTAPQASGLIPINAVSSRASVVDHAVQYGAFDTLGTLTDPNGGGTFPVDAWVHYHFKRNGVKKGIDYALPMDRWNSAVLQVVCGTRDQLFSGGTPTTWDMTGCNLEFYADLDIDTNPDQIHAAELFEQVFNITAANPAFQINALPQGCFYDNLYFITEVNGALADTVLNNIAIEGGGRSWLVQGQSNAKYIRQRYTKPIFADPNAGSHGLTGLYVLPLRDGLWSRALDSSATPIVIKCDVSYPGGTVNLRVVGRKLVPGGVKKTIGGPQNRTVVGLPKA